MRVILPASPPLALMLLAILAAPTPGLAGQGTRFEDFQGPDDHNSVTTMRTWTIELRPGTDWLEVTLPRPEALSPGGDVGVFNQETTTWYLSSPPHVEEDRSEWYTRLTWPPGALNGGARVEIREETDSSSDVTRGGLHAEPVRRPGDWYTSPSLTIPWVAGIDEAVRWAAETSQWDDGLPFGEHGVVQRWMAYVNEAIDVRLVISIWAPENAASAWNAGLSDPWGQADVFASGLRALGFPTCVGTLMRPDGEYVNLADRAFNLMGVAPWVGVWCDGLGFLPVDLRARHYGFLASNVQVGNYVEDFQHLRWIVDSNDPTARVEFDDSRHEYERPPSTRQRVRTRRIDDGGIDTFICQDTPGHHAPGPVTAVPDTPASRGELLIASHPFRQVLSLALRLDRGGEVTVTVFDVAGRRVALLADARAVAAGETFFRWLPDTSPAGVYFVQARLDDGRSFTARAVRAGS
ncbi:MAG TPA: transglutaminase-like domain-containing protein [Candidatus Eisenbacteria bacterium]